MNIRFHPPTFKTVVLFLSLWGALSSSSAFALDAVRLRGSETFLPLVQRVAEDYMASHPNAAVIVNGGGSTRGYKSLLDGTADAAFVSGPMSEEVKGQFERHGVRVRVTVVGLKPLVAVVNASNPIKDLTSLELGAIFSGRIKTWPTSGKTPPISIQVLVGSPTGGLTETWKGYILADGATFPATAQVMTLKRRIAAVLASPSAITYLALGEVPQNLRILTVGGVAPTPENVSSGAYPLASALKLVALEKAAPVVDDFVNHFFISNPLWDTDGLQVGKRR